MKPQLPRHLRPLAGLLSFSFCLLSSLPATAQWAAQTITLRPGWNAVFLEVQPEPRECDAVFAGLPVETVWRFNRRQTTVQFIDDPNQIVASQPNWLIWLPNAHPLGGLSQLFTLEGGRPYLIKLADNAPVTTWTAKGTPILRSPDWLASALNFVGFPLPTNSPPTIQAFFTNSPALATNRVYRLSASGLWSQVNNPATNLMQRGEAFWIRSTGLPDYAGPLEVQLERRSGLDFGRTLTEQTLRIRNPSTNQNRTVAVRLLASEPIPVTAGLPVKAGSVPLSWWQNDFAGGKVGWTNLATTLVYSNLPPGGTWELRLAVRRADMTPFTLTSGAAAATYQSLLEVTEAANLTRLLVPVSAEGMDGWITGTGSRASKDGTPGLPHTGLWVGTVTLTNVSQPSGANPLAPVPTASEFEFRLLVHVDAAGQARLLQRALLMWRQGQTNSAGGVAVPGRYVLLTDEQRTNGLVGATLRDGKAVGRRFSSAAFSFRDPLPMNGTGLFGANASVFLCAITNGYNSPLNPFVHRFHPDHDNLDDRGAPLTVKTDLPAGPYTKESWTVKRTLELHFAGAPPDGLALSGWGDTQVGGTYRETLSGLHASDLVVQGYFRLHQAARVETLNDGL